MFFDEFHVQLSQKKLRLTKQYDMYVCIYMEFFIKQAINMGTNKPSYWDATFVVLHLREEELQIFFLQRLNDFHPDIKFTTESEKENELSFLDVLVRKKSDGSLGHKYRNGGSSSRSCLLLQYFSE